MVGAFSNENSKASSEALLQPCHRKRKHGAIAHVEQNYDQFNLEVDAPRTRPTSLISVKIAALEALEALLTVVCTSWTFLFLFLNYDIF